MKPFFIYNQRKMSVIISQITESLPAFVAQKSYSKIIVLTDFNTKKHCYPVIKSILPKHDLITILSGEKNKNLTTCEQIWQTMTDAQLDRHALMINLGGGVIGDMGGFCAATYKRGIDFIQIPTTLLSQVDASVGGKLGIDFHGFKNHIGVFTLPNAVLIDDVFLKTLPQNELRSGFAEIIKHCLIQDAAKWNEIRFKDLEEQNFSDLISHSVEIKKKVVEIDPTEKGLRKILNFGHTLGHAIETHFLDKGKDHLLHGEAIAAGMICESFIAFKRNLIDEKTLSQIEEFIFSIYGKANLKEKDIESIIKLTQQDKKNKGKEVRFSIIDRIGNCLFDIVVSNKEMSQALEYYIG
jgi:3-dehydroquinate synthase